MAEQNSQPIEQEIASLERQLAAKRAELGGDASAPFERAEVHDALTEQINMQVATAPPPVAAAPVPAPDPGVSWQDPALAASVQELVNVAFTQGVQQAIAQAVKSGNPALVDALHDVLADELHQQLLERSKLEPAP